MLSLFKEVKQSERLLHFVWNHVSTNNRYLKRRGGFPGPMVSNFSYSHLKEIREIDYLITEKSDGVRMMMYHTNGSTYFFGRNLIFYESKEKIKFPNLTELLVDGEMFFNLRKKTWNYTIFDVVCYGKTNCNNFNMRKKVQVISDHIVMPYLQAGGSKSFNIVRKHFYEKDEINLLFSKIVKNEEGEYIYKGNNMNDGLIFTPVDVKLYHFTPGPSMWLLKWKWDDKLTCDFELHYDKDVNMFFLRYQQSRKNPKLYYYKEIKEIPKSKKIVECFYDQGDWKIVNVRDDKVRPNTFMTIISVIYQMIENITREDIIRTLSNSLIVPQKDSRFYQLNRIFVFLILFFTRRGEPILCVYHSDGTSSLIAYVRDCVYYLEEDEIALKGARLENHIKKTYRKGNVCRLIYLPSGVWSIVAFDGHQRDVSAYHMLEGLEAMSQVSKHIDGKSNKRYLDNKTEERSVKRAKCL